MRDRLEDDRGDVVLRQRALDVVGVVEAADDRRVDHLLQHALRERVLLPHVLRQRDHVHRDRVVPAVVAALELDHVAAAGGRARDAQRMERRLAPRLRQEHALRRRHEVADPLGELDLDLRHADAHQPDRARRRRNGGVDVGSLWPRSGGPKAAW